MCMHVCIHTHAQTDVHLEDRTTLVSSSGMHWGYNTLHRCTPCTENTPHCAKPSLCMCIQGIKLRSLCLQSVFCIAGALLPL